METIMKKDNILPLLLFLLSQVFGTCLAEAQSCRQFPADCPDNEMLQQMTEKKWEGPADLKVKEEYAMQDNLRDFFTSMMQQMAKRENWQYYLFLEDHGPGIGIEGNTKPLPYPLRHPCQWGISFVFIVNEDSLHAWQNWYNNDLQNEMNKAVHSYKQSENDLSKDEIQKKYFDSAGYYGDQKTKYMTGHAADYQKAIVDNDIKGQKKYEVEMKRYDDMINASINKANGKRDETFSGTAKQQEDFQTYKHNRTMAYRNASIIRVTYNVNEYTTGSLAETAKTVKLLSEPDASLSVILHNSQPDEHEIFGQYLRSPDYALLLFGKWVLKLNVYNSYDAVYRADKKSNDAVSVKKIPCDKVQTIIIHVEGGTNYIYQFLQSLDIKKLNSLIDK